MPTKRSHGSELSINFWPSFTDITLMMILILIVFIFAQIISNTEAFKLVKIRQKQEQLQALIMEKVGGDSMQDIKFSTDFKAQHITFSDRVLFDSGSDIIKSQGRSILEIIWSVLLSNPDLYTSIQIEGHTDKQPLRGSTRFRSNWDLSSSRATAVVEFFDDHGLDPAKVPLSAAGFSEYRPVDMGDTPEALERNRRIEMIINYSAE